ncbi:MAG: hypothetical protein Q9217_003204 [Psora testacea]
MGLSKSTRILILLGIDSAFFLLELIVGYAVHSLALVADSFHMLNDVLSLCVGLWAVKVAHQKSSSKMYTYGWQRAETLGALVNGVFLVALCLSIFLEAIQRFVEPQSVSNPKLVLIVGCFGLLSNILGLFLFHEHGHSHGGGGHSHSHESNNLAVAEEGQGSVQGRTVGGYTKAVADESRNVADALPQSTVGGWPKSDGLKDASSDGLSEMSKRKSKGFTASDEDGSTITASTAIGSTSPLSHHKSNVNSTRHKRRHGSGSRSRFPSVDEIYIHPASFRNEIIAASRLGDIESQAGSDSGAENAVEEDEHEATEAAPLLRHTKTDNSLHRSPRGLRIYKQDLKDLHTDHTHNQSKEKSGGGGHSHSDLNMRGVFLHVMGDALGNIGVIGSALIIWLTSYSWRFYADPLISLVITVIILGSAIPLCKAASRILLQAVPPHISVDDIKQDIEDLPGIISCHHLHVWQLSGVKLVASLHIQIEFDFKGEGSARYMQLARAVRRCLHEYGIHSSTIQPEFCLDSGHRHTSAMGSDTEDHSNGNGGCGSKMGSKKGSKASSLGSEPDACLLECSDECGASGQCCAPAAPSEGQPQIGNGHSH